MKKSPWKTWSWALLIPLAMLLAIGFGALPGLVIEPPAFQPTEAQMNGWVPDAQAVKAIRDTLPEPRFADTEAGISDDPLPQQVFLWQAYFKLFGANPPSKDQGAIGACTGFGNANAVTRTLAVQIALQGDKSEYRDISEEVIYGGGRVQIGKGKVGRADGGTGVWCAQFVQQYGIVARDKYAEGKQTYDLTTYSVQTCRAFGASGCPKELEPVAKRNPVKSITQVNSWTDAKKALANGYGVNVCSNQGFTTKRDANGVCVPSGNWSHSMAIDGYAQINGKEYGHIENSWGATSASGPVGPGNPSSSGFYADSATIDRMLKQNDSWAFSSVVGFPSRKIDWFVMWLPAPKGPHDRLEVFACAIAR